MIGEGAYRTPFFVPALPSYSINEIQLTRCQRRVTYCLNRSNKRRSVSLSVKQQQVKVNAPTHVSLVQIEEFIQHKQEWLINVLDHQSSLPKNDMTFTNGDKFLLLGNSYTLSIQKDKSFKQMLCDDTKVLTFHVPDRVVQLERYIKAKLHAFYLEQAEHFVTTQVKQWQNVTGLVAKKLEFKVYKSRWGCCYANGTVKINPLLMAAPKWVIDCVIIHELCHLKHMNHSAKFWQLNKNFCSDCKDSSAWLSKHVNVLLMRD